MLPRAGRPGASAGVGRGQRGGRLAPFSFAVTRIETLETDAFTSVGKCSLLAPGPSLTWRLEAKRGRYCVADGGCAFVSRSRDTLLPQKRGEGAPCVVLMSPIK